MKPLTLRPLMLRIGSFRGAPIYVHWSFAAIVGVFWLQADLLVAAWGALLLFGLILLHEIGHALVVRLTGARVEGVLVMAAVGYCLYEQDPDVADERDEILIAWGGVFAQLPVLLVALAGFALVTGSVAMPRYGDGPSASAMTWTVLVGFNAAMVVTNLVPLPGLDGETAWRMNPLRAARAMWLGWASTRSGRGAGSSDR